ncbi:MAG: SDR family oxidoreductase [Leptospiraceae bacterium]|nr:SDR family oxidoreductase [Leptospiraceae bacterium]
MNILILGATGFIGESVFHSLLSEHSVRIAGRQPIEGYDNYKFLDFTKPGNWDSILEDIDLVINAIGILEGDFSKIQSEGPIQFYNLCIERNIKIIHISAVGAENEFSKLDFLESKKKTDDFLLSYKYAKVIYPGIVIGKRGKSSRFFAELASLPILLMPKDILPPLVHIQQLTELIKNIINKFEEFPNQIFAVSKPENFSKLLSALNPRKRVILNTYKNFLKFFFLLFPKAKIGIFSKEMLTMLDEINAEKYWSHPKNYTNLKLASPMYKELTTSFIKPEFMEGSESIAYSLGLISISFIWIWSALSSVISWDQSYSIMKEVGANHELSVFSIYLGTFVDLFLGLAVFSKKYRSYTLLLQIFIVVVYTIILTIFAPHYWLHPFGVVGKNIPLLALSYYILRVKP